jgi:hypothetical protein
MGGVDFQRRRPAQLNAPGRLRPDNHRFVRLATPIDDDLNVVPRAVLEPAAQQSLLIKHAEYFALIGASIPPAGVERADFSRLNRFRLDDDNFEKAIQTFVNLKPLKALVLGTGGASKAVQYILAKHAVPFYLLSRSPTKDSKEITYEDLNQILLESHTLIINCTPLGTFPNIDECPNIPFEFIGDKHFVYDLVYNPTETLLMKKAKAAGAKVANGISMLENQAEASWEIWNK